MNNKDDRKLREELEIITGKVMVLNSEHKTNFWNWMCILALNKNIRKNGTLC